MLISGSIHPLPGEAERRERLVWLVDRLAGRRVLVVGDVIADEFIYGQVARVSREAPVLILQYDSTEMLPGGAGNAANNVAALGGRAQLVGLAGRDDPGRRVARVLRQRVRDLNLIGRNGYVTPVKTRILAGGVHSAKQQIVRIDRVSRPAVAPKDRAGRQILKRTGMSAVLITRGSRGMALFEAKRPTVHIPIFGSDQVTDVTGAGDTVIATMTLALAAGASFYEAACLANYAGGLVVMKRGTATVSPEELRTAIESDHAVDT
jgi:bifunctional ADP-heptose synthase (sugar kinase/adenylyltransferase)